MDDLIIAILDRLSMAYLSYRAGQLSVISDQVKALQDKMDQAMKLKREVDTKPEVQNALDDRFNPK